MERLAMTKIKVIRRAYLAGQPGRVQLAALLGIQADTVSKYLKEFREIEERYPKKLKDFTFLLPRGHQGPRVPYRKELISLLPQLVAEADKAYLSKIDLWKRYRQIYPKGCGINNFYSYFNQWQKEHHICKYYPIHVKQIPEGDMAEFNKWRGSGDTELWRKAVIIQSSLTKRPISQICAQTELSQESVLKWIDAYKSQGIKGLIRKPFVNPKIVANNKVRQENIRKLLQQAPKQFGINRAAWSLATLSRAYEKTYESPLSTYAISAHLVKMGYNFQRSKERLSSPDKHFREKLDNIKHILSCLRPDEKFFSVDEYGPAVINVKTGWSLTRAGECKTVQPFQKKKGWYIMTAALELSTNQVTHFYSTAKNTIEMIRLIKVLSAQYCTENRLFLSWDAASWHKSKVLNDYLRSVNAKYYRLQHGTPEIVLAPLPASAQFLNVIESVFSGMVRAVIHNSDYGSTEECHAAIDRYFFERNEYFRLNPKRAGNKIWGQEVVSPVFSESNDCKRRLQRKPPES